MLVEFWRNPEFIRHVRAELRPARMAFVAMLVLVICAITGLFCWLAAEDDWHTFLGIFYATLLGGQGVVLCLWWTSACSDAISGERVLKTYDFLRTTRLTADELLVGKLMGAPVVALFAIVCSLPVSLAAGLLYGVSQVTILATYALLLVFAPLFGLFALLMSLSMEKPVRGVGFSGFLLLWALGGLSLTAGHGPFPGLAALSSVPAVLHLHGAHPDMDMYAAPVVPLIFGSPLSLLLLTPALQVSMAAWLVLMIRRNLKKEVEEISLLSRWQAIGLVVYLNLLFYAFLDRNSLGRGLEEVSGPEDIIRVMVLFLNGALLFAGAGMAAVTPREPLKIWWRRFKAGEAGYFSENGLPWPWLALAAVISYAMLALYALSSGIPLKEWKLGWTATQLLFLLVFAVRDVLFLQWCKLTRMKNAVTKGAALLMLQYVAVVVVMLVIHSATERFDNLLLSVLTPFAPLDREIPVVMAVAGIAAQVAVGVLLLTAITRRLDRPVTAPVAAE